MKKILFIIILLFFTGCINKQGVSLKYYDECHIRYEYYGSYEEFCPYNIYNFHKKEKKDCLQCN